jgi:hypothetical protein
MNANNNYLFNAITAAVLSIFASGCAQSSNSVIGVESQLQACALSKPPIESGWNESHGVYFFVYPRALSSDFTGCQNMWDQSGSRIMQLKIINGHPETLEINYAEGPQATSRFVCRYVGDVLMGNDQRCPSYEKGKEFGNLEFPSEELRLADKAYSVLLDLINRN